MPKKNAQLPSQLTHVPSITMSMSDRKSSSQHPAASSVRTEEVYGVASSHSWHASAPSCSFSNKFRNKIKKQCVA